MLEALGELWRTARKNIPLQLPLEQVIVCDPWQGRRGEKQGISSALAASLRRRQINSSMRFLTLLPSLFSANKLSISQTSCQKLD